MTNLTPFDTFSPETLVVRLYSGNEPEERHSFLKQLSSIFPHLNWRGHIFIVDDDPSSQIDGASEVIRTVAEYLLENKLSTIYIHPFVHLLGTGHSEIQEWEKLLGLMQPFQQEAYDQQGEVRMLIFPILEPDVTMPVEAMLSCADFFRSRLAKPSLYLHEESCLDPVTVLEKDLRVYVDPSPDTSSENVISQLWINHVFEDVLERIEGNQTALLNPCRTHLVIDEKDDAVFTCFSLWERARPLESLEQVAEPPENVDCSSCSSQSCLLMEANVRANARSEEGRQVFLELGVAFSKEGRYSDAVQHARKAFELSNSDVDRAAALLHQGLCHLNLMELTEAEEALRKGATYSSDVGLFAYHLGSVQFARQDYIDAISRFEESLAAQSPEVPKEDLLFNLAVSNINLEEYGRARPYLDLMAQTSAHVWFYQGICDLAEGLVESALVKFRKALTIGPAAEDLSRVLFYIGTCLKEMGQYNEAITELERAIKAAPQDYMNYNLLGFCFYQAKQHEKAIEVFHRAIEINPGSAIDYASIGSNLRELGRFEDAIAMYHMALSIDPALTFAVENIKKLQMIIRDQSSEG